MACCSWGWRIFLGIFECSRVCFAWLERSRASRGCRGTLDAVRLCLKLSLDALESVRVAFEIGVFRGCPCHFCGRLRLDVQRDFGLLAVDLLASPRKERTLKLERLVSFGTRGVAPLVEPLAVASPQLRRRVWLREGVETEPDGKRVRVL